MSKGGIMKNKKEEEKQKLKTYKNKFGHKIWKIVAIAVILIFVVIIAGGLIKAHYLRSSFIKPTRTQIDYATKVATEKLQSMGVNSSAFQIQVGRKMRILYKDKITKTIIQVSFYNNATTHTYLIDIKSGETLLHSETDVYAALENRHNSHGYKKSEYMVGFYPRFFEHNDMNNKE